MIKICQTLFFLVVCLLVVSCGNDSQKDNQEQTIQKTAQTQEGKEIKIKGQIQNPLKGMITLEKLDNGNYRKVTEVEAKGSHFVLLTKISEPDFYRLNLFNGKQFIYLVLNETDVEVLADASGSEITYKVLGSKDTEYFRAFNVLFNSFKIETKKLNDAFSATDSDVERKQIELKYKAFQKDNVKKVKAMIDTIIPSISVLYALNVLEIEEEFDYMEKIAGIYAEKLPDSRHTKSLVANIERIKPIALGKKAPDISLISNEGKVITLSSLKGKLVLIDFWASWCKPCRMENPNVLKVYQKYKDKGLEIYGISLDKDKDKWLGAIATDGINWLHVLDAQGEFAEKYLVEAIPNTFLIDKDGKIIAKNLRGEALEERIAQELN